MLHERTSQHVFMNSRTEQFLFRWAFSQFNLRESNRLRELSHKIWANMKKWVIWQHRTFTIIYVFTMFYPCSSDEVTYLSSNFNISNLQPFSCKTFSCYSIINVNATFNTFRACFCYSIRDTVSLLPYIIISITYQQKHNFKSTN